MRRGSVVISLFLSATLVVTARCHRAEKERAIAGSRPRMSILLVTLDTTRADAIGPEAAGITTPSFNALAKRGLRFRQAYATVPQTLPSHTSMLTGLYPGGHGLHENGRYLSDRTPLVTERLHETGYRTAAFVSAFALARRFGLGRGFDVYDDQFASGLAERSAAETTDRAIAYLRTVQSQPVFLWVHYYEPHYPYTPPEPFRTQYAAHPYLGEVAAMDQQLGRLTMEFQRSVRGPVAIVVTGDHGEGLGEHGEAQHGNLLYQATMHVPLVIVAPGVKPSTSDNAVSTRRIYDTLLDLAGLETTSSLRSAAHEVVAGEAMKPFLDFGWQPQVMAIDGSRKAIAAGPLEVYDLINDPGETKNLASSGELSRAARAALHDYPIPAAADAAPPTAGSAEEQKKLASLGYVSAGAAPVVRKDAPRPSEMTALFPLLDRASGLFVREQYAEAIPLLKQILAKDPHNLDAALRLASAESALGHDAEAVAAFRNASVISPDSADVRTYLALHYARGKQWHEAVPLLERIVAESPDRLPAVEALAVIRERQGRLPEAVSLRQRIYAARQPSAGELIALGHMAMQSGQTPAAIEAFERARASQGAAFSNDLELGALYMDARRFEDARMALDRVKATHPGYAMALFKRAQVSSLLHEPDLQARIAEARSHATPLTRQLIERERLFH